MLDVYCPADLVLPDDSYMHECTRVVVTASATSELAFELALAVHQLKTELQASGIKGKLVQADTRQVFSFTQAEVFTLYVISLIMSALKTHDSMSLLTLKFALASSLLRQSAIELKLSHTTQNGLNSR